MAALAISQATPSVGQSASATANISVLDPRGEWPVIERAPLAPRLQTLSGKRIAIIKSWPSNSGFDQAIAQMVSTLQARGAQVTVRDRNTSYSQDDPKLWEDLKANADAFVYVAAASSSTTAYAFRWSALLERQGLPGVVANFTELNSVGDLSNARFGVPVRRVAFEYPPETMPSDQFGSRLEALASALTTALAAEEQVAGPLAPTPRPEILMTGSADEVQDRFYADGLTDGLPIVPPTPELVAAMLKGTSHSPDEIVAKEFPPEGLIASVRSVAINGIMAGCKPEHMPILLASMEAFQVNEMNSILRSTNAFSFMQVVNGPIREEAALNASSNAVGPGNRANGCLGRALRLFVTNLGDGHFGTNLMAVIGNNSGYSFLFAENEEQSPWTSLAVDQGFKPSDSVLTLFTGGWAHAGNYGLGTGIEDVPPDLARFQMNNGATVIVSPARAAAITADGMNKQELESYFQEHACRTLGDLRKEGRFQNVSAYEGQPDDTCVPRFAKGSIKVVVAGNDASPMMQAWSMYRPVSVSIDRWR